MPNPPVPLQPPDASSRDPSLGENDDIWRDVNDDVVMQSMPSQQHSRTMISLLQQILEQQREQLIVQREQLKILQGRSLAWQSDQTDLNALSADGGSGKTSEEVPEENLELDDNDAHDATSSTTEVLHRSVTDATRVSDRTLSVRLSLDSIKKHLTPTQTVRSLGGQYARKMPRGLATDVMVEKHIVIAGVLPKHLFQRKCAYNAYIACLCVAEFVHCLLHVKTVFFALQEGRPFPAVAGTLLVMQPTLFHHLWRTWGQEFALKGASLQLLQQMDKRGFTWASLHGSIHLCRGTSALLIIAVGIIWFNLVANGDTDTQRLLSKKESRYAQVAGMVSAGVDALGILSQLLWLYLVPVHVWMVFMVSSLHQHDLLSYTGAVMKAFEAQEINPQGDIVQALRKLEVVVTARLRLASTSWVRFVVIYMVCLCLVALILCMFLLTSEDLQLAQLLMYSSFAVFNFSFITALSGPLAMVAETFEYDVVRALNNPAILKIAQRHVGQQILPHLQHLDWGFRIAGSTITADWVAKVAFGVLVALATGVCQAAFGQTRDL